MIHGASQGESLMFAEVQRIGFGGGCHWSTKAVFAALRAYAWRSLRKVCRLALLDRN